MFAQEAAAAWLEIFLAVTISMLITLIIAMVIIGCWILRRRRQYSKTAKDGGRRNGWIDHRMIDWLLPSNPCHILTWVPGLLGNRYTGPMFSRHIKWPIHLIVKLLYSEKNSLVAAVEEGNVSSLTALLTAMTPLEAANAEDVAGNTVVRPLKITFYLVNFLELLRSLSLVEKITQTLGILSAWSK